MLRLLACLLATLLVPASLSARQVVSGVTGGFNGQPPRDVRPATGRSTIRGRVTAADSGQPMRRATVRVTAPELRVPRTTLTDVNGRYEFQQLPAGRYSINAMKNVFVSWSYGQTQPGSLGKPLVLADNQTVDDINISLPRGSVITGRITDEFGDPAPNVFVSLMRFQFQQGQQRLMPAGNAAAPGTNDIGEYRMFGLSPGQYYVTAQPQQQAFSPAGAGGGQTEGPEARNGYARTFYPGTADVSAAQKITVGVGQTLSDINIVLLPTRLSTISGVAVDAQGQPMNGAFVQVMPRGGIFIGGGGGGGSVRPDGSFMIGNIAPGQYTLRANAPRNPSGPGTPSAPPDFSIAVVSVNGEDINDVRLAPVVPVTVSGRVLFDDAGGAPPLKPSVIQVMAQPMNVDDSGFGFPVPGGPPPPLQDDFSFELKTAPGRIALRAIVQPAPGTPPPSPGTPPPATGTANVWQLKAVRINGTDVTDSGIEIDSRGARGVEIELTNRRQQVSGSVSDANGVKVKDYTVVMFAQDRARWTAPFNRYLGRAQAGADGLFKVSFLPAGDYYAIALDGVDGSQWQDPEFLEGLIRQASSVSLAPGDTRTVDLKLFTVQ